MVNCKHEGCTTRASYGIEIKKASYCSKHKLDNMFLVTVTLCKNENCKRYPHYNFLGESRGIYCVDHKKDDMKSLLK